MKNKIKYNIGFLLLLMTLQVELVQAEMLHIAAAANLRFVLPVLVDEFEQQTDHQLAVSYAASGTLTTQIQHGAPFDVFLSASPTHIQRLADTGFAKGNPVNYAHAQLALFVSNDSLLDIAKGIEGITLALQQGILNKIAIANPKHAPYGQVAQRALEAMGIWQKIQPHLIIAENASQVMQFSLSSSVDAGFVPYSLAIQPKLAEQGKMIKLKQTLQLQATLLARSSPASEQFLIFIQQPLAKDIFLTHGFL